ncbi:hypothetical protein [Methylorubrum extorquens]|uniref:hypothetical protein n=1 Tax=Methylorubrum extorquens TaxID=408 RepID=UPI000158F2FC|nr:hypothetical protein [Methylorubrum extorquens]ABY30268.1 hypothetical protein Mext_1869 [Methylorubrum extorquens PA1]KQP93669.1 hypothetical protein ASF55_20440 [Methylobacterium sp. Leaf119]WIU41568.1 hypothetical protein KQ926_09820 [Methylorubrum extorquens]
MTNLVRFPGGRRIPAATIPRAEFERLAELALDVVDQIVALLNEADGDPELEDGGDAEPSLGGPKGRASQVGWLRGGDRDLERN